MQEASINLIGCMGEYQFNVFFLHSSDLFFPPANRGAEFMLVREWMHICFKLLDLLKAHKKGIQHAAVNSFGYIAKSLGSQDVLSVLLTNFQVQERQSRVCSTVTIAIVAETCGPFTCIPAILNEYRTAELNVRTGGCLKALTFVFEYIDPQSVYYCDLVGTTLEDALTDRDLIRRQTASIIVKHIALGVAGMGCEDYDAPDESCLAKLVISAELCHIASDQQDAHKLPSEFSPSTVKSSSMSPQYCSNLIRVFPVYGQVFFDEPARSSRCYPLGLIIPLRLTSVKLLLSKLPVFAVPDPSSAPLSRSHFS
ncbi:hypothetical protein K503DRAFT_74111 [Rhizopogon vinicolor AM-OR11-026]|uniref:Phosphatase PP2A regulatory subunit A/Splicing factor 3B subunit 1-like HEAT repeat domain-containing protein n=1 Tax=Rhizopogon vinicolor AM-OR11-026 TaxID=1314800 RepID=A0A1B7MG45_9AGAM|nr:hypothetical protein K503DRAFT_74111 [Rhizopogon vinicolor AM-OR11-026]